MFKVLIPAAAALGLLALAARTESAPPAAEAETPGMAWHLSHEGESAKLAYGLANSDQLALMMTCAPGDAEAVVYGDAAPVSARLVPTRGGPDPLSGEAEEMRLPLSEPGLRSLASQGRMTVAGDAGRFTLRASPEERRLAERFLSYCGTAPA
jgi:hypothetical protein